MRIAAILVAAGQGSRFGAETPKQFLVLAGQPVIRHAASRLAARAAWLQPVGDVAAIGLTLAGIDHLPVVFGGATRQDSVRAGLEALVPLAPDIVLVHDAARPFFPDRTIPDLVEALRTGARSTKAPPVVGLVGPYADALVHGEDIRIPLGVADDRPAQRWQPTLDFLMTPRARIGFLSAARPSLTYAATDSTWTGGAGPRVEAPSAALALALLGRTARLGELVGPGSAVLRAPATR